MRLDCSGPPAVVASVTRATRLVPAAAKPAPPAAPASWRFPLCVRVPAGAGRTAEPCGWIDGDGGRVALGVAACPSWIVVDDDGTGYYVTSYPDALARALRAHAPEAPLLAARADDLRLELSAGRTTIADAMAWAELLNLRGPSDELLAAVELAEAIGAQLGPELRPRWQAWVRLRCALRARTIGVMTRGGEAAGQPEACRALAALAALEADDAALIGEAEAATRAWLDRGRRIDDDTAVALRIAAGGHDLELFDRLVERARTEPDRAVAAALVAALASARDPRTIDRLFELLVGRTLPAPIASAPLVGLLHNHATHERAWALVTSTSPARTNGLMPWDLEAAAASLCTAAERTEAARWSVARASRDPMLAAIDDCIARRAHHAAGADAAFPSPSP